MTISERFKAIGCFNLVQYGIDLVQNLVQAVTARKLYTLHNLIVSEAHTVTDRRKKDIKKSRVFHDSNFLLFTFQNFKD